MKSIVLSTVRLLLVMGITCSVASAQFTNLQLHKELGSINVNDSTQIKRNGFKAKFEMLGVDSLGTYYWNTSTQYSTNDKSVSAQVQVLRGIRFSKHSKLQALVGFQSATGTTSQWYVGVHYPIKVGRVKFLPFLAYVYNKDQRSANFRFTSGVSTLLLKKKILLFGFVNAYTRDKVSAEDGESKEIGFQANPQVWFRFSKQLAVGGEVTIDYLGSRYQKFISIPTAGARWSF
ncbi:MAG: DUF5020 family protein [Chryseolinea sp.]